jgi:threonine dehydratase
MLASHPDLDVIVVPVGGGGLISGVAIAAHAVKPDISIVGVQASRFPAMRQALAGEAIACGPDTIAEGIAVKQPGELTLAIIREQVDEILLVDESDLERAVQLLLDIEKTVVEGAGGAGLAAVLANPEKFRGRKTGIVLSGGNIDSLLLSSIIQRGLVRSRRLVRLQVDIPDRPGGLAAVTRHLAELDASVVEVFHHRHFTTLPVKTAEVEFVLKTRGLEHFGQILDNLSQAGYNPHVVEE